MNYLADNGGGRGLRSLFDDFFLDFEDLLPRQVSGKAAASFALDIEEMPNSYVVRANLPGVSKDNLDISLERNQLRIHVKDLRDKKEENSKYLHRERVWREMTRVIALPNTSAHEVEAELRDGVLTVTVRKDTEKLPRKIEVK